MGRSVTEIRFRITENPQLCILEIDDGAGARGAPVYARLRALGASDRLARQWISQHGEDAVAARLDFVAEQEGVRSPVRYLSAALKDGFGGGQAPAADLSGRTAQLARVRELVAGRTPTQRDADRRLFLSGIRDGARRADFERHGWMSPLNAEAIFAFWDDMVPPE